MPRIRKTTYVSKARRMERYVDFKNIQNAEIFFVALLARIELAVLMSYNLGIHHGRGNPIEAEKWYTRQYHARLHITNILSSLFDHATQHSKNIGHTTDQRIRAIIDAMSKTNHDQYKQGIKGREKILKKVARLIRSDDWLQDVKIFEAECLKCPNPGCEHRHLTKVYPRHIHPTLSVRKE